MKQNKPVIEDIILSSEQMDQLNSELKRRTNKPATIRKYTGGVCTFCAGLPIKKVSYDVDGGKLIEWFCHSCYQKRKSELNKRLQNMNLA